MFPRVKQMFNQSSYRFQKSQCDKCSWKYPANRATSDWTWPRFRKHNKEPPIPSKSWRYEQRREEVPVLRINSPSLGHRFCLYLLLRINYSIEAGSRKDKLILFTVQDQFMYLKIYICKSLVPPCRVSATETHLLIKLSPRTHCLRSVLNISVDTVSKLKASVFPWVLCAFYPLCPSEHLTFTDMCSGILSPPLWGRQWGRRLTPLFYDDHKSYFTNQLHPPLHWGRQSYTILAPNSWITKCLFKLRQRK